MIILLSAKQGGGKTTLAKALYREINQNPQSRAYMMSFAEPLYLMHDFCWGYLKDHGIEMPFIKDGYLLQLLGTEWGRTKIRDSLWVDLLKAKIDKTKNGNNLGYSKLYFIISDCRFKNEFDAFDNDALKIRLICSKEVRKARCEMWRETDTHPSEVDLDEYAADGQFDVYCNTEFKTLDETVEEVRKWAKI